jgi:putative membrane protein
VLIPRRRVQLAVVESGPFRRLFGWSGLGLQTLGGATGGGESGRQTAVPLGTREEIAAVLAVQQGYRIASSAELSMVSSRYVVRRLIILTVPLLALLAGSVVEPAALLALPLFGLAALLSSLQRRRHLYGISEGFLFVQRGLWRERQWIVPVGNIQSLRLSRSWLQRKLGLATLGVDTAGAPAFDALRIFDLNKDRAEELADALR